MGADYVWTFDFTAAVCPAYTSMCNNYSEARGFVNRFFDFLLLIRLAFRSTLEMYIHRGIHLPLFISYALLLLLPLTMINI